MSVHVNEQETVINFMRDSDKAIIYTSDTTMLTRLHKLVEKNPKEWKQIDQGKSNGEIVSETFECPKKLISFRSSTASRVMTEEQRKAARERMKEWLKSKERSET